jgi:nucleotide-binding universal stress UspA family protein
MFGFRRICCPVDFSDRSREAMHQAAELARREGAALTLVHVRETRIVDVTGPFAPLPLSWDEEALADLEQWRVEAERVRGAKVDAVLLEAPVALAITRFARDDGIDLIVLSSHGRTGVSRFVLGSVAEAVVRRAPCPVLLLRDSHAGRREVVEIPASADLER